MKLKLTFVLILVSVLSFAQEILLSQDVKGDTLRPIYGPNLKHFTHGYFGIDFPLYTNEDVIYTNFGTSSVVNFGFRYKRKVSNTFAVGFDMGANLSGYRISQEAGKTIPDTIINDKEKFQINTLSGSAFMRLNIGRRGNSIGNYFDVGGYGGWNMVKRHKTINENEDGEKVKLSTSRLNYIENFSFGLLARLGIERYAFTAAYRLSDAFVSSSIPELPRLSLGLEVGLFDK